MTRPNVQSLEYYRQVVALGLAKTHACPLESLRR